MNKFTIGLITTVGLLVTGIVYMASFDNLSDQSPYDSELINALRNLEYDDFRDNDTHYDRIDREKKYYGAMREIKLVDSSDDSIEITFDANYFQINRDEEYVSPQSQHNSEFTAIINKGETFVARCNSFQDMPNRPIEAEDIPAKQMHVLKYTGITEKNGTSYYGFAHEAGYTLDHIECKFPEIILHSLDIDFDISNTNFYGDVWDFNWK